MSQFTLTNKAKSDLRSIAAYTQRKWGPGQRRVYVRQFDDSSFTLAESPSLGIQCDFIKRGYRKFPVASHLVFYRSNSPGIEIVRVLHKRMDANQFLPAP